MRKFVILAATLFLGSSFFLTEPSSVEGHGGRGHRNLCFPSCHANCARSCREVCGGHYVYPQILMTCDSFVYRPCQSGDTNCRLMPMNQWGQSCDFHKPWIPGSNILLTSEKGVLRPCQASENGVYLDMSYWANGIDLGGTPADVKEIRMYKRTVGSDTIWWPCQDGTEQSPESRKIGDWGFKVASSGSSKPVEKMWMYPFPSASVPHIWEPCPTLADPTADFYPIKRWGRTKP
jgi:hypothetical protein